MTKQNPYRLTREVVPNAYRLFFTPDLENYTFDGRVEIDIDVNEAVSSFALNAIELELSAATITLGGQTFTSASPVHEDVYETATFNFDAPLPTGTGVLEISFKGILNDQLHGFYRSHYRDQDGVDHVIATTQFENSDARRAFPCWDEPAFKATYQVNLTIPSQLSVYSNNPVAEDIDLGNGKRNVSFTPTMKMSTYLVAFVIGPFEETETVDVDGVPLRVVYPKGYGDLTALALDSGAHALRYFSNYFGIPYPGEKVDMIAIPDFGAGAMENLGCITYRMNALLVDPVTSSLLERSRVVEVVCHEMAHMWFGDLVTMDWWQGIWLNEAFATFMEAKASFAYRPDWEKFTEWQSDREVAQQIDGMNATRPVEYEVVSPDDMRGMFDALTYEKGGWVLRMIEQYLGEEVFRKGIHNYLVKHSYANTVTSDLWEALADSSGENVGLIMDTFIMQGGFPVVTFEDGKISQEPFSYVPKTADSSIGTTWQAPMHTRSLSDGTSVRRLLGAEPIAIDQPLPVSINGGGWGYFRTRYGKNELQALTASFSSLDKLERATLVGDAWALTISQRISWADFLSIAKNLTVADSPSTWLVVAEAFEKANRGLTPDQRVVLAEQARSIAAPALEALGWNAKEGEDEVTGPTRSVIIGMMGTVVGDKDVIAEACKRFDANDVSGDLARQILRIVARQNRPGDYQTFLDRMAAAKTPQEEVRYLYLLTEFRDEKTALDVAAKCFDTFRLQESNIVMGLAVGNAVAGPAVWRYLVSRWDEAVAKFPPNTLYRVASGVVGFITDEEFANEVEAFHVAHPVPSQRTVLQFIELMHTGIGFTKQLREQF